MRTYTVAELERIAEIIYDTTMISTATVFDGYGMPLYKRWIHLDQSTKFETIKGLEVRIAREGLEQYLERKRKTAGDNLTDSILSQLKREGLI